MKTNKRTEGNHHQNRKKQEKRWNRDAYSRNSRGKDGEIMGQMMQGKMKRLKQKPKTRGHGTEGRRTTWATKNHPHPWTGTERKEETAGELKGNIRERRENSWKSTDEKLRKYPSRRRLTSTKGKSWEGEWTSARHTRVSAGETDGRNGKWTCPTEKMARKWKLRENGKNRTNKKQNENPTTRKRRPITNFTTGRTAEQQRRRRQNKHRIDIPRNATTYRKRTHRMGKHRTNRV